jgi:carboxyl-terminal processing protease
LFPFAGSPAALAGLSVGDTILEVDGRGLGTLGPGGLQAALNATDGEVQLAVRSLDGSERRLGVRPERIVDPTVRHARLLDAERGIGYLAIVSFSHKTPGEFDAAIADLQAGGGLQALVIDLRGNPGGILDAAARVANRFLDAGTIVSTLTRDGLHTTEADPDEARLHGLPLVLLVDGGSASSSEVLAGALQDHRVAVLVGEPTYGKGTVQTLTSFDGDRAVVKLTTAVYYTPAGRRIERIGEDARQHGLAPDVEIELLEDERLAVHRFLASYSPPAEVLPALEAWEASAGRELVQRPPADRQLAAAIDLVDGGALHLQVSRAQ